MDACRKGYIRKAWLWLIVPVSMIFGCVAGVMILFFIGS